MIRIPRIAVLAAFLAAGASAQSSWNLITPQPTPSPQGRGNSHATTDGANFYLFGGRYGSPSVFTPHVSNELWQFDGTSWTQLPNCPAERELGAFTYRPGAGLGKLVLFGGRDVNGTISADTWEYDIAAQTWAQMAPAVAPTARYWTSMVFSVANGACLLFGGYDGSNYLNDTWLWDGLAWTQLSPAASPSVRARMGLVWDLQRNVAVMFGGTIANVTPLGAETWEWDGATWSQVTTATLPYTGSNIGIVTPGMAYDALRGRVVMTCGAISSSASTGYQDETWEFDGTDWTSRGAFTVLERRGGPALEFVPAHGRTYLFGGFNPNGVFTSNTAFPNMDNRLFEYSTNHVASFTAAAGTSGCPSTAGTTPSVAGASLPWAGTTAQVFVVGVPTGSVTFALLDFATGSLDLTPFGAPGCTFYLTLPTAFPTTTSGNTALLNLPIPNDPNLFGGAFFVQGLTLDAANNLGLVLSNRGDGVIGAL